MKRIYIIFLSTLLLILVIPNIVSANTINVGTYDEFIDAISEINLKKENT